jgi:hypothetical protein
MFRSLAFGIAVVLGAASGANAQSTEDQAACTDDAFRVCPHTIPDRERTFQCMIANRSAISPACQAVIARFLPPEPAPKKTAAPRRGKGGPVDLSPTATR